MGVRVNPMMRIYKNVYRTYIDVINFVRTDKRRFNVNMEQEKNDEDQKMEDVNNQEEDEAGVQDQLLKDDHEHMFNDR
jgi:hypothetical protein